MDKAARAQMKQSDWYEATDFRLLAERVREKAIEPIELELATPDEFTAEMARSMGG